MKTKIYLILILSFLFSFSMVFAQDPGPVVEKDTPRFPKRKVPDYTLQKAKVLELIEARKLDEFIAYMQTEPNAKEILIEKKEHVLTHLLKTENLEFAQPLMKDYQQKYGTPFPKTSIYKDSLAYLKPACNTCQIDLLKSLIDDKTINIKPSFILKSALVNGCKDEERLISFFEKTDAFEELGDEVWPSVGVTAIENNRTNIIKYLVEKKNLKLEKRGFTHLVNKVETLEFLWELGMQQQGLSEPARHSIVQLLWKKASLKQIDEILARGIISKNDLSNDRLLGSDFLEKASTVKIKYVRDLFLSENKTIKFYRVKNDKSEERVYTREEMFMIMDVIKNTDYYTLFAKSLSKPEGYDEYTQFFIFQTCLAADKELFDYLVSKKEVKVTFPNLHRKTVLHYAAIAGNVSFFKYIYEKYELSASLSKRDTEGFSPLKLAKKYERTELVTYLETLGAR